MRLQAYNPSDHMSQLISSPLVSPAHQFAGNIPFARALARNRSNNLPEHEELASGFNPNALANTGDTFPNQPTDRAAQEDQSQAENIRRAELFAQRNRQHELVNPQASTDIYNARQQQVKEQIVDLRRDIEAVGVPVIPVNPQINQTLSTRTVEPKSGKYLLSFYQQLRSLVVLIGQRIRSAKTWSTQMNEKSSKKAQRKGGAGIQIMGMVHERTASVHDKMRDEIDTYSGG